MKPNSMTRLDISSIFAVMSGGGTKKCNCLCELVRRADLPPNAADAIKQLSDDNSVFWNTYLVSDFAQAAMHILGIEKYEGGRDEIKNLIDSKLIFLRKRMSY